MNKGKEQKLQVLSMIKESKSILFGAFSSTLTKQDKANEWSKILQMCKAFGLIKDESKDFSYIRDTFWPNLKKATLAKVDNSRKTGSEGGKGAILNEIDNLVLDIIGKDSPSVVGLGQIDTLACDVGQKEPIQEIDTALEEEAVDDPGLPTNVNETLQEQSCSKPTMGSLKRKPTAKRWITKNSPQYQEYQAELKLKKRKLELEVEHLELMNHKLKLEIFKEENELGLERSKFTVSLIEMHN